MKKYASKIFIGIILVCLMVVAFLYGNNDIGISADKIENDIRVSQKIQHDWVTEGIVSDTMAAYISYSQDKTDHTFSVYVNRPGVSFGYFFRGGGDIVAVEEYISEFTVEGYNERAFISMNSQRVNRLEIVGGNGIQIIDINSEKPFAIVLPINAGRITFYDIAGNIVEWVNNPL